MAETGPAAPYGRYLPRQPYLYSNGWAFENARHGSTNLQGFNNSADFKDRMGVLVVGDSFIESLMLSYSDTVQGNLDRALGGGVYAAASSGNGLADSLETVRYFAPRFHPRTVVLFVEPTDMSNLLAHPVTGHSGFTVADGAIGVAHQPYVESKAKLPMLRSALVRYFYYNLKFPAWLASARQFGRTTPSAAQAVALTHRRQVLDYYFAQLHATGDAAGVRFVFLVDGDRKAIYSGKPAAAPAWQGDDRAVFQAAARAANFAVVDMQAVFAQHWAAHRERMDFLPVDGHWNAVAHRLAAERLLSLVSSAAPVAAAKDAPSAE